jgi:thymidylate synthase
MELTQRQIEYIKSNNPHIKTENLNQEWYNAFSLGVTSGKNSVLLKEKEKKCGIIEARDLDELYFVSIRECLEKGRRYLITSGSHKGSYRYEFDSAHLVIKYPTTRPLAPQPRAGIPVPTNDVAIEKYFTDYIMDGRLNKNEHYRYSSWIVGMPKDCELHEKEIPRGTRFNQLDWCIKHFKEKGFGTNHCYITIGCAEALQRYDWPYKTEEERGSTECLRQIIFKVIEKNKKYYLNEHCLFRSWDLIGGLPENLGGLTLLMEYVANELEIEPGELIAYSSGLHVYEHHLDIARLWVNKEKIAA